MKSTLSTNTRKTAKVQVMGTAASASLQAVMSTLNSVASVPLTKDQYAKQLRQQCEAMRVPVSSLFRSMRTLYDAMDANIYAPYCQIQAMSEEDRRTAQAAIEEALKATGSKTSERDLLYRMTKAIMFGAEYQALTQKEKDRLRRLVSSYSMVMQKAYAVPVKAGDLGEWIESNHGIEAVRLDKKAGVSVSSFDFAGELKAIRANSLHVYDTADCFNFNKSINDKQVLLFGTYKDGSITVHEVSVNDAVFRQAIRALREAMPAVSKPPADADSGSEVEMAEEAA